MWDRLLYKIVTNCGGESQQINMSSSLLSLQLMPTKQYSTVEVIFHDNHTFMYFVQLFALSSTASSPSAPRGIFNGASLVGLRSMHLAQIYFSIRISVRSEITASRYAWCNFSRVPIWRSKFFIYYRVINPSFVHEASGKIATTD